MNSSRRTQSKATWSEKLAWGVGVALLLSYSGVRMWLDDSRERALSSFRELSGAPSAETSKRTNQSAFRSRPPTLAVSTPNMAQWSASRRHAFEQVSNPEIPLAILRVDELALEVPVYESTDETNLNRGAGWIAGTSRIGEPGNVGVAAHRDGYFRALKDIELGQTLVLETHGGTIDYRVTDVRIVTPDAIEVLAPTEHDSITLVTCYPFYYVGPAPQRFIVTAERSIPRATIITASRSEAGS